MQKVYSHYSSKNVECKSDFLAWLIKNKFVLQMLINKLIINKLIILRIVPSLLYVLITANYDYFVIM